MTQARPFGNHLDGWPPLIAVTVRGASGIATARRVRLQINLLGARLWCCRVDHPSDHRSQKHLPIELQVYPHEDLAPLPWLEMHVQCFLVPTARAFESSKDMRAIRPHIQLHQPMYETASADAE